jgi:urea transport system permease protein
LNWLARSGPGSGLLILAALILVVVAAVARLFRLNLVGKYLTYAFVAVGLVMLWGYGGILSLGQGVFFGLGGYMHGHVPEARGVRPGSPPRSSRTPGIPDFMDWNQITALPLVVGALPPPAVHADLASCWCPTLLAFIIGFAMFKRRVGGVYFAIITQAVALILTVLIIGQQGYTGGVNGITDLKTCSAGTSAPTSAKYILYFVTCVLLLGASAVPLDPAAQQARHAAAGDARQGRPRALLGLRRAIFKVFVFCLAAMLSAIGGAMFTLQVGFMSPSFVGIVPSDRDGDLRRGRRPHVAGRRGVRHAAGQLRQDLLLRELPELWLFLMGALFIGVVMAFPNGLAGLESTSSPWLAPRKRHARRCRRRRHRHRAAGKPLMPATARRESPETETDMSNTDFVLAVEDLTVSFDGFKAVDA